MQPTGNCGDDGLINAVYGIPQPAPKRQIETHKVNGLNSELTIEVQDDPGLGGACCEYRIRKRIAHVDIDLAYVRFQKGPVSENGVNGVTNEVLLAIVRDRLECFQQERFACSENAAALGHVVEAMKWLHRRTKERFLRGVEGTNTI